jgi:hypothetical protein
MKFTFSLLVRTTDNIKEVEVKAEHPQKTLPKVISVVNITGSKSILA